MQPSVIKILITYLLCFNSSNVVFADGDISFAFNETVTNGSGVIQFPDDDGVVHNIDLNATLNTRLLFNNVNKFTNQYFLYTRQNDLIPKKLKIDDANSIKSSNFNPELPTVVVVHGWKGNLLSDINFTLRNAFLRRGDYNIIVVDWSRLASKNYVSAVIGVPRVGQHLGKFLTFLNSVTGASIRSMHLVGHSLGAHVVGNAGRNLDGRVARITGLDPAGPLWTLNSKRLRKTDAAYVEAIHTNGGIFGTLSPLGLVDFYPNGGADQPGCSTNFCNHRRSWVLFAASVTYNHLEGHKCTSVSQFSVNICRGSVLKMGNGDLNKIGSGVYRLKTKAVYPF